ncbi:YceD family protein [Phenylobacterium sp.]|jgi:uncharacterized metal-binding protein YceD (DUF177 family)|uniref:YceD family protein n=1 Tax=Phenylobacterium sp. TaxID=1871053 RepID=UPI003784067C
MSGEWTWPVRLHEIDRGPVTAKLEPDAEQRARIAKTLDLRALPALTADVTVTPWLDGAEIRGRFRGRVEQICSLSLEPFEQDVSGEIEVKVVPADSPNAAPDDGEEVELAPDAPDPPDVLAGDTLDLAAYLVEHLSLAIDPFPRKPGASFDYVPPTVEESPFAVLRKLKDPKG